MTTIEELQQLKVGAKITGEVRERAITEAKQRYQRGMTIRQIARHMNRSYGWVHRALRDAGVELRPRGGNTRLTRLSPAEQAEYRQRLEVLRRKRR